MKRTFNQLTIALALATTLAFATPNNSNPDPQKNTLEAKVRHELLMLPYFGIFDNLQFQVDGATVTLIGQVNRPVLRSDAVNVVKRIEGVSAVNDQIEVLPLSNFDDQLRVRVARTVYGQSALNRYALGAHPTIHIIVKNGNVTLEGVVSRQMDSTIANLQANTVPGVFTVTNNLHIEK